MLKVALECTENNAQKWGIFAFYEVNTANYPLLIGGEIIIKKGFWILRSLQNA